MASAARRAVAPAATHRSNRRGRIAIGIAALGLVALLGAGLVAIAVSGQSGGNFPILSAPAPLLAGAPALAQPPAPTSAATGIDALGYDASYPQCGRTLPTTGGFAIVGVTGGRPFSTNPCLSGQIAWARTKSANAVYLNTSYSGSGGPIAYGRRLALDAVARERAAVGSGTAMWWLDVETVNNWNGTQQQNATVLDSAAATLQRLGARVGIYSTPTMWAEIAGSWQPGLPTWYATSKGNRAAALRACTDSFAGSRPSIVQWIQSTSNGSLDHDYLCPTARRQPSSVLVVR